VQVVVGFVVVVFAISAAAAPFSQPPQSSQPPTQDHAIAPQPTVASPIPFTPEPEPTIETPTPTPRPTVKATPKPAPKPVPKKPAVKKAASNCDPNYSGACLRPDVEDYDCAGGSGNGPYYVEGPIRVVGDDHYRLDSDHDGIACE